MSICIPCIIDSHLIFLHCTAEFVLKISIFRRHMQKIAYTWHFCYTTFYCLYCTKNLPFCTVLLFNKFGIEIRTSKMFTKDYCTFCYVNAHYICTIKCTVFRTTTIACVTCRCAVDSLPSLAMHSTALCISPQYYKSCHCTLYESRVLQVMPLHYV